MGAQKPKEKNLVASPSQSPTSRRDVTPMLPTQPAQQNLPTASSGPLALLALINEASVSLFQAVSAHYHPGLLHPVPWAGNGTGPGGSKAMGVELQRGRII